MLTSSRFTMASDLSNENNPFMNSGDCLFECEATLKVGDERFYVCKEMLCKFSEYFRGLFMDEFKEKQQNMFEIKDENPADILCFLEALVPHPAVRTVTDRTLGVLMRLADKYQTEALKSHCSQYILNNANQTAPDEVLQWLKWIHKYNFAIETAQPCLPIVACFPLDVVEANREQIGLFFFSELVTAKLKATYVMASECQRRFFTDHAHFEKAGPKCDHCGTFFQQSDSSKSAKMFIRSCSKSIICSGCKSVASCRCSKTQEEAVFVCGNCKHQHRLNAQKNDCHCWRKKYHKLISPRPTSC